MVLSKALSKHFHDFDHVKFLQVFPHAFESVKALEEIQKHTYTFKNIALISLIHSSCLVHWPINKKGISNNEPLEFLGDAILSYVIAEQSLFRYPYFLEGPLSQLRSCLVDTHALHQKCLDCGLHNHLLFGDPEAHDHNLSPSVLAGAFEAVTAALWLDGGPEIAYPWIKNQFDSDLEKGLILLEDINPRSCLQQWIQSFMDELPQYKVIKEEIKRQDQDSFLEKKESSYEKNPEIFLAFVSVKGQVLAKATGKSKKQAMVAAAKKVLDLKKQGLLTEKMIKL